MGCIWMKWDECTFADWGDEEDADDIDSCDVYHCPHFEEYFPENEEYAKHDAQLRGWDWREARGDYD